MSEQSVAYTFKSEFADEDILYTFGEILSDDFETKIVSRVRLYGPRSAEHLCTIVIKLPPDKNLEWPEMSKIQKEVIKELMIEQKDPNLFPAWYGGGVPPHYDTNSIISEQAFLYFILTRV